MLCTIRRVGGHIRRYSWDGKYVYCFMHDGIPKNGRSQCRTYNAVQTKATVYVTSVV